MTQQPRVQASGCGSGTVPDWSSRFNGQPPYQQSERLPHHRHQQQQRLMMPTGAMIRQQLPTYQNVVDQHLYQDMMLKHTWQQQQQQRHLMHLQSMSQHHRYIVPSVASESCNVGGFCQVVSSGCVMTPSTSSPVSNAV